LHYEIQNKIVDQFDTGYTDEYGLRELVAAASETMSDLKIAKEKKVMKRFLKEITRGNESLALYGEDHIRKALQMGAVEALLLAEDLRKYRITLSCPTCKYSMMKTVKADELDDSFEELNCPSCKTPTKMEITEKIDLIDELSELAENTGAEVFLISQNSEEGDSLVSAFSGIAAITRYPLDL
jgi:peptide chain release factor subunit 1